MAQRTTCYRSDAGNDFPTEHEALKDDLRHYIESKTKNAPLARDLTEAIISDLDAKYEPLVQIGIIDENLKPELKWQGFVNLIKQLAATRPLPEPGLPFGGVE